jgi:hypothetical protein
MAGKSYSLYEAHNQKIGNSSHSHPTLQTNLTVIISDGDSRENPKSGVDLFCDIKPEALFDFGCIIIFYSMQALFLGKYVHMLSTMPG